MACQPEYFAFGKNICRNSSEPNNRGCGTYTALTSSSSSSTSCLGRVIIICVVAAINHTRYEHLLSPRPNTRIHGIMTTTAYVIHIYIYIYIHPGHILCIVGFSPRKIIHHDSPMTIWHAYVMVCTRYPVIGMYHARYV